MAVKGRQASQKRRKSALLCTNDYPQAFCLVNLRLLGSYSKALAHALCRLPSHYSSQVILGLSQACYAIAPQVGHQMGCRRWMYVVDCL